MGTDEEIKEAYDKLDAAIQEYMNVTDEEAPVVIRGWGLSVETMILADDGRAGYQVSPITGPTTSGVQAIGLLNFGADKIQHCLLNHGPHDE